MKLLSRGFREHKEGVAEALQDRRGDSKRMAPPRAGAGAGGGLGTGSPLGSLSASVIVTAGRVLESSPPVFVYCIALQEAFGASGEAGLRVLSGGSDGRIKVSPFCSPTT